MESLCFAFSQHAFLLMAIWHFLVTTFSDSLKLMLSLHSEWCLDHHCHNDMSQFITAAFLIVLHGLFPAMHKTLHMNFEHHWDCLLGK